jgi:hypothetical protein
MPTKVVEGSPVEASPAADAVDEAIRTVSDVSRRGAEEAKRVISTSNSLMSERFATGHHLYEAWFEGVEALLKASFKAQDSLIGTAPKLLEAAYHANKTILGTHPATLDAVYNASKTIVDSLPDVMHQYQKAVLEAVEDTAESTEKFFTPPAK